MNGKISFERERFSEDNEWTLSIMKNENEPLFIDEYILGYNEAKIAKNFVLSLAFGDLTTVNKLFLPKNVKDITAFLGAKVKEIIIDEQNPYLLSIDGVVFTKDKKELVLYPAFKTGTYEIPAGTVTIRQNSFRYSKVNEVIFPDSIKEIGKMAFWVCTELKNIKLNQGIERINEDAFEGCFELERLTIPNSIHTMDYKTFNRCYALHNIEISPDTEILFYDYRIAYGDGHKDFLSPKGIYYQLTSDMKDNHYAPPEEWIFIAIRSCKNRITSYYRKLLAIAKASGMKQISEYLLDYILKNDMPTISKNDDDSDNLKTKTLENGKIVIAKYIGKAANLILPLMLNGCEISGIGELAFAENDYIENIIVPEGYVSIGRKAFKNCISLKTVKLPDSVNTIGDSAFEHCINMEQVSIPDGITKISGHCFKDCSSLKKLIIPDSVLEIGNEALSECKALEDISLPKDLTAIGSRAFLGSGIDHGPVLEGEWGYSLREIEIPDTVESIGKNIFAEYPKAKELFGVFEYKVQLIVRENTYGHKYAVKNKIRFKLK